MLIFMCNSNSNLPENELVVVVIVYFCVRARVRHLNWLKGGRNVHRYK